MWTSGRLVNVWNQPRKSRDVKDIYVCVHTGNIPQTRGYFRNVKVPSSPYKRGREGTCKRIHNFWGEHRLSEILCLPFAVLVTCVLDSCVWGLHLIFEPPNTGPYCPRHRRFPLPPPSSATTTDDICSLTPMLACPPSPTAHLLLLVGLLPPASTL
jgi:hypothetical protein